MCPPPCASGSIIPSPLPSLLQRRYIYRAHTVYAVIANGRANIFLFPRSTHAIILYGYICTDGRALPPPPTTFTWPDIVIVFFVFYAILSHYFLDDDVQNDRFACRPSHPITYYIIVVVVVVVSEKYRNSIIIYYYNE